ncbi:right-handed parallel beta-helix repeat-containing protein [bacterium]|nr:right-handed parallel beta-helix repeat-containing protein [bacterium]
MKRLSIALWALIIVLGLGDVANASGVFNYQGHLNRDGHSFTGTADFYFAIYRKDGSTDTFLWVNDDGDLSVLPPSSGVPVDVDEGRFSLEIGDTSLPNMSALPAAIFEDDAQLFMRVWVDAGDGVQQLSPDKRVHLGPGFGYGDEDVLTIYVDGISGDDLNSGLRPNRAKKTIQGGIDALPPVIHGEAIVQIADGIYEEGVAIHSVTLTGNLASLTIQKNPGTPGDVVLQPGSSGETTGLDIAGTDRPITITGLTVQGFSFAGVQISRSSVDLEDCTIKDNLGATGWGIYALRGASASLKNCTLDNNHMGIYADHFCDIGLYDTTISNSEDTGVYARFSTVLHTNTATIQNSGGDGIYLWMNSNADLRYTTLQGNAGAGLRGTKQSCAMLIEVDSIQNGIGIWSDRGSYLFLGNDSHSISNNTLGLRAIHRSTIEYYGGSVTISGNGTNSEEDSTSVILVN